MLPRRYRLRRSKDFHAVYQRGNSFAGRYVVLYLLKGKGTQRFGFSVSSKVGKAVVRNKVKRQFREICRRYRSRLQNGRDVILIARQKIKGIPFSEVEKDVIKQFKRAKLWTGGAYGNR
ncbi:ribonuclease P protein component [Heliorestis acidaminivorans]|uniref:Ribonuclease P protein component n=1 Tax=Heliorestis acidaminivorans TaxID=553427 RepID=A0A6I0ETG1_9FIRM|nr:ribonuclease P protein component [Heliorestis acidaminivorans]KAB2953925.1 ribonuclease P protein component [Heliorestis acidaminivorans]